MPAAPDPNMSPTFLRTTLTRLVVATLVLCLSTQAAAESPKKTASSKSVESTETPTDEDPTSESDADELSQKTVDRLKREIDALVRKRVSAKADDGIAAVDTTTGQVVYTKNADETFNTASNTKLLTSAAALDRFGPSETFQTNLACAEPSDGVVDGPLYVEGEGDAFLLFEDFIQWAAQLKLKGIDRIKGDIVIDDEIFDGDYLPPGFDQKDEDASYRAPIGAVSVNFNAVTVIVTPNPKESGKPSIRMFPPNDYVTIENNAQTVVGPGQRLSFTSDPNDNGGTTITVDGRIGNRSRTVRSRLRIDHPPAYAGSVMRKALAMVDVTVDGGVGTGSRPGDVEVIVSHDSQPLSYIVLAMNKWSNNFMAEQLLRKLGTRDGKASTWKAAKESLLAFLEQAGLETDDLEIHNGSGLYDGNLVTPRQFTRLLTYMLDHRAAPEYLASLAIAGKDGTLKDRMEGEATAGNVRAKTGTLNDASALSGYVTTASGRKLAFSVLIDDTPRRAWRYRPVQDDIVELLAEISE